MSELLERIDRLNEIGIALSNVFGGITQVMFLVFPFTLLTIGVLQIAGPSLIGRELTILGSFFAGIPINFTTILLIILLFPVFYVLLETIVDDRRFSNFDATVLTSIYILVLYMLISYG